MTGFARVSTIIAFAAVAAGAAASPLCAQTTATPPVAAVESLFADATAKETAVRKALTTDQPRPTLLKALRLVVADYENVVRHYPTSGFCDDALWRAAGLARDGFEEFHESRERTTALRLFQLLASGYPSSRLAKQVPEQVAWLNTQTAKPSPPEVTTPPVVERPPAAQLQVPAAPTKATSPVPANASVAETATAAAVPESKLVSVKAIRRTVLADVVRVVIELDAEVAFHDERLENPSRVFLDLPATRSNSSLIDQTLRFDGDTDVVRQIRIGRHPNSTTRVVLEAAGVSSYSVYPLYSPFRLVIDCLRAAPAATSATAATAATTNAPRTAINTPRLATTEHPAAGEVPAPIPQHTPVVSTPVRPAQVVPPPKPTIIAEPPLVLPSDSDRPAWARPPARMPAILPAAPPVLAARRVRWVMAMPSGSVKSLPSTTTALPSTPASAAATPLPAGEPSRNVAGGLSMARQLGLGVSRIVIDPGHGGHDPGAKGADGTEAELVLDVALRLEKLLDKLPGVDVVLTRRGDDFIPLQERTAIANREGADLFLSIHANASSVPAARGIETYFLNFASNQGAAAVAARENATSVQTMGALQDVVKAIALNSKLDESRDFATYVQREMLTSLRQANSLVKDLGVKQAPFVVLIGASMPSVLAEVSFLTNPQEARLLKGSSYRQRIAQALFEGIKKYQVSLKDVSPTAQQQN